MVETMNRRRFLLGLLAAPAVIRTAGLLMPVKAAKPLIGVDLASPAGDRSMLMLGRLTSIRDWEWGVIRVSLPTPEWRAINGDGKIVENTLFDDVKWLELGK